VIPLALAWGEMPVDSSSVKTLVVKNAGGGTLTGTVRPKATCSPDFTLLSNGSPVSVVTFALPAGQSQSVPIRYTVVHVGPQACDFDVVSN
jgi:hypothetical protein